MDWDLDTTPRRRSLHAGLWRCRASPALAAEDARPWQGLPEWETLSSPARAASAETAPLESSWAKGRKLAEIVGPMRMVAEGIKTTYATVALAERHGVEMPITWQVYRTLEGQVTPREAIRELMERTLKDE